MIVDNLFRQFVQGAIIAGRMAQVGVSAAGAVAERNRKHKYNPNRLTEGTEALLDVPFQSIQVQMPRDWQWNEAQATQLMERLTVMAPIVLEIVAQAETTIFQITPLSVPLEAVQQTIQAVIPQAQFEITLCITAPTDGTTVRFNLPIVPALFHPAPIRTSDEIKTADPLVAMTQAMDDVQAGECVRFSVVILGNTTEAGPAGMKMITRSAHGPGAWLSLGGAVVAAIDKLAGHDRVPAFETGLFKVMAQKLNNPLYHTFLILSIDAADGEGIERLFGPVAEQLGSYHKENFNTLTAPDADSIPETFPSYTVIENKGQAYTNSAFGLAERWLRGQDHLWRQFLSVFDVSELTALWHPPHTAFTADNINWSSVVQRPLPKPLRKLRSGIWLGDNVYAGKTTPAFLPETELEQHMLIIGKTGTGKSTAMGQMALAGIGTGTGMCAIDPHGSLIEWLLQHIPAHRMADVMVIDLSTQVNGTYFPPGVNPLAGVGNQGINPDFVRMMGHIYPGLADMQIAYYLELALKTLRYAEQPTLWDIRRVFDDAGYRDTLLQRSDNLNLPEAWRKFERRSERDQDNALAPLLRRLEAFYDNNHMLAVTCHPQPINIAQAVAENKIILVNLGGEHSHLSRQERYLIGATIVSQIEAAALAGCISDAPFMLYVDEAQHFVTTPLPEMLAEVRKYGLGMVLANQFLRQLSGETQDALEGTIGTMMAFEIGKRDAQTMGYYMQPEFDADTLPKLGKFRAAVSLRYDGERLPAFSVETQPLLPPDDPDVALRTARIRQQSVEKYTPLSYREVIDDLNRRFGSQSSDNDDFFE